ncbi:hypothetical protein INR49_031440 [Caranx melampygus]|nr:hypothetical protein INR49_031440 [Caranx melampygus]
MWSRRISDSVQLSSAATALSAEQVGSESSSRASPGLWPPPPAPHPKPGRWLTGRRRAAHTEDLLGLNPPEPPPEPLWTHTLSEPTHTGTYRTSVDTHSGSTTCRTSKLRTDVRTDPSPSTRTSRVKTGPVVLTQRDPIGELVVQVEDLAKGPQELQNHQSFSKEFWWKTCSHWNGTGQLLEEPQHRRRSITDNTVEREGQEMGRCVGTLESS